MFWITKISLLTTWQNGSGLISCSRTHETCNISAKHFIVVFIRALICCQRSLYLSMLYEVQTGKAKYLSSNNIQHSSARAWILDLAAVSQTSPTRLYDTKFQQQQNHLGSDEWHHNNYRCWPWRASILQLGAWSPHCAQPILGQRKNKRKLSIESLNVSWLVTLLWPTLNTCCLSSKLYLNPYFTRIVLFWNDNNSWLYTN